MDDDRITTSDSAGPFAERLLRGEKVIWRGRPQQGFMLTPKDAYLIPYSLVWGGFSIFWESNVLRISNAPVFMPLFGATFVLIGLFMIFGRFFVDGWIRAGVFYALTDRRILILRSRPSVRFQSVNLGRLPETTLNETSNGRGTIWFGPAPPIWNDAFAIWNYRVTMIGFWVPSLDPTAQFLAIEDVKKVFASLQERAQGLRQGLRDHGDSVFY
jgi:hypothetical protein